MNNPYTIKEAEAKLKELSPDFTIVPNEKSDLAGVYWKGFYAEIALPKDVIFETRNVQHQDAYGATHRSLDDLIVMATRFLERITTDNEYLTDITTKFEYDEPTPPEKTVEFPPEGSEPEAMPLDTDVEQVQDPLAPKE